MGDMKQLSNVEIVVTVRKSLNDYRPKPVRHAVLLYVMPMILKSCVRPIEKHKNFTTVS